MYCCKNTKLICDLFLKVILADTSGGHQVGSRSGIHCNDMLCLIIVINTQSQKIDWDLPSRPPDGPLFLPCCKIIMILDIFKTHMTDGLCRTLPVLFSVFPRKMFAPQTWDCQIFADVPSISQGNDRGEKRSNIQIVIWIFRSLEGKNICMWSYKYFCTTFITLSSIFIVDHSCKTFSSYHTFNLLLAIRKGVLNFSKLR